MTTFTNGPAHGTTLMIRRAPRFLRVVIDKGGVVDALDQLNDQPRPDEVIQVYTLQGDVGSCHISARGKGGKRTGGLYVLANYTHLPDQPTDSQVRTTEAWQAWVTSQPKAS